MRRSFFNSKKSLLATFDIRNIGERINDSNPYDPGASISRMSGMYIKPDGTRLFMSVDYKSVVQYDLSTPWDVSTNAFVSEFSLGFSYLKGIHFNTSGSKMYVCRNTGFVYEYNLSTSWDIDSASLANTYAIGVSNCQDLRFSLDGTKMYTIHGDVVRMYSLSTAFDTTTITFDYSFSLTESTDCFGLEFSFDGTKMYTSSSTLENGIDQYILAIPWDISSAVFDFKNNVITAGATMAIFADISGKYFYMISNTSPPMVRCYNWLS